MDTPHGSRDRHSLGHGTSWLLENAFGIAVIGLVLLGLGGTVYKAIKPDGWLSLALDQMWSSHPALVWLVGLGITAALLLTKCWLDRSAVAGRNTDALIYAFMALGLFFFFQLLVTGSL